jgi:hypothetical protein
LAARHPDDPGLTDPVGTLFVGVVIQDNHVLLL